MGTNHEKENWDGHLPLTEIAYNNGYHVNIGIPPYEACMEVDAALPLCWEEVGKRKILGPELVQQIGETKDCTSKWLVTAQYRQRKYADQARKYRDSTAIDKLNGMLMNDKQVYVGVFSVQKR